MEIDDTLPFDNLTYQKHKAIVAQHGYIQNIEQYNQSVEYVAEVEKTLAEIEKETTKNGTNRNNKKA